QARGMPEIAWSRGCRAEPRCLASAQGIADPTTARGGPCDMATTLRPDPTLYPSPRLAREAPVETLAYMVTYDPTARQPDALLTIDVDPGSPQYREVVGRLAMPNLGDELHHFGWNVCSSALCPYAPHPHTERRYLLLPGLRSSRIYV